MDTFSVYKLGMVPYKKALELQFALLERRTKGATEDLLLLLEHPPTVTTGRRGKEEHLLLDLPEFQRRGIHFEVVSRGGDVTYHGPGQLVGYPILDLNRLNRDVHKYLRNLEEMIILTLESFKIRAERIKGITGVWVNGEKIASIGIGVKRWTTYHGFALNINTDLSHFDMIVPCGIQGIKITSMKKLLGENIDMPTVEASVVKAFSSVFNKTHSGIVSLDRNILNGAFDAEFLMEIERKLKDPAKLMA